MDNILQNLEWLARYGIIDIFFGLGVLGFVYKLYTKIKPSNLDELHVGVNFVMIGEISSIHLEISNTGSRNIYITKAYFKPFVKRFCFFQSRSRIVLNNKLNLKSQNHGYYEVRFGKNRDSYDVLVKPGFPNRVTAALPLDNYPEDNLKGKNILGTFIFEYSTYGKNGAHTTLI